jgi:hypothetical protein
MGTFARLQKIYHNGDYAAFDTRPGTRKDTRYRKTGGAMPIKKPKKRNPPKRWFQWRERQAARYEKFDHPKAAEEYREQTDQIAKRYADDEPEARQQVKDECP